ncbi:hypothetical protein [Neorhizobium sp. AL 9.2.2]|uniref:hypothetical protein n=1 Tax=Neorhizobium sp. AL 9.2.2 TaxID=2712894 RepID=UPI0015722B05|nr:hypothetical protein [Neorhizobium sp. AL 9.2.2]NSY17244.1 hypothetical protein [Neorhizobium sp. AL 9.2.2]
MTDWSTISDDEFVEEAQRRVNQGQWSPDRFMSQSQCDDRAKLRVLVGAIITMRVNIIRATGSCPDWLQALASKCDELDGIYGNPLPERAYAINTTFVGKETAFQDHSPKAA